MTQIKHIAPAPGLEDLQLLVGKWHTEGEQLSGPFGPTAPFVAVETFEWLEGGHFLIHRLDGRFGETPAACIEVLGLEAGELVARTSYSDGRQQLWKVSAGSNGIELRGSLTAGDGATHEVRCVLALVELGNALEATWSERAANEDWNVFLRARGTKAQPLPSASIG